MQDRGEERASESDGQIQAASAIVNPDRPRQRAQVADLRSLLRPRSQGFGR
jgi:hypothetical protein